MAIHLDKTIGIILGVIVLVLIILTPGTAYAGIKNFISNLDIGGIIGGSSEETQKQATSLFSDLITTAEECKKSTNVKCFCANEKVVFPNGYSLVLDNNNKNLEFTLRTNKNDRLSFNIVSDVTGCYIVKGGSPQNMLEDEEIPLKIIFGSKNTFLYRRTKYDVDVEKLLYKTEANRICIIDKDSANKLKDAKVC